MCRDRAHDGRPPAPPPEAQIEAGADFVVTQLFYDCDRYLQFVKDCRWVAGARLVCFGGPAQSHRIGCSTAGCR